MMRVQSTIFTVAAFLACASFVTARSTRGGAQRSIIPPTTTSTTSTIATSSNGESSSTTSPLLSSIPSSDDRITDYVAKTRQLFFVVDHSLHHEGVVVFDDPHNATPQMGQESVTVSSSQVYWVCNPQHAPNRMFPHSSGQQQQQQHHYDNVIAHGLVYTMATGLVSPYGYVATRIGMGEKEGTPHNNTYDEFFLGYDNHSIQQIKLDDGSYGIGSSRIVGSGTTYGGRLSPSSSGRGEWITDVEDSRLMSMSHVLGIELTPENCDNYYKHSWDKAHTSIIGASASNL
jgi:hypothetical protein